MQPTFALLFAWAWDESKVVHGYGFRSSLARDRALILATAAAASTPSACARCNFRRDALALRRDLPCRVRMLAMSMAIPLGSRVTGVGLVRQVLPTVRPHSGPCRLKSGLRAI